MRREEIGAVRRDERADLEDDLVAVPEHERARVAEPADAVHVEAHGAAKAEQSARGQLSSPHAEEVAEARGALHVDDPGRVDGPEPRTAARRANADPRRDDDHAVVREELEVDARPRSAEHPRARRVHPRSRVVRRPHTDRRRDERKHRLHAIALLAVVGLLAGCGGGSSGSPTLTIQPAGQYRLEFKTIGAAVAGKPTKISMEIIQPDGKPLTKFKRGSGPHTGVHLIMVRRDLAEIVHRHPPISADGRMSDAVVFPAGGPYRVVVDVYPQQTTPQPNFQLFSSLRVQGAYTPQPLPPFSGTQKVDGFTFALHGTPNLHAIQASLLDFTVTSPDGKPASFTPWFGALAHAIFFRAGSLDYFHTHVCAPGASGCTSVFGSAKVTGTSATPGKLHVGVLVPVAGTWRLFLQCQVDGHVLTAPFTLKVR
jgi:hypothetical protein